MAFEPRIVRPDDGAGDRSQAEDRWLPDDLQELAGQLSADAARLTAAYPLAPLVYEPRRAAARQWLPRSAVAAVLLAAAGLWLAGRGERSATRPGGLVASKAETAADRAGNWIAQSALEVAGGDRATAAGDLIVEASGQKIGSVQQAVDLILAREPGATIGLVVERAGERRPVQITLCGETAGSAARQSPAALVAPSENTRVAGRDPFDVRNGNAAYIAELSVDGNAVPQRGPRDELGMLQMQIQAFGRVIAKLQAEVLRRDQLLAETSDLVNSLTAEVETLRKQQTK